MCGRYSESVSLKTLKERFGFTTSLVELKPRYNIAPSQEAPVIIADKGPQLEMFRWGLIPYWAKDMNIGYSMINARADTITEKPSYKKPFERSRCLVIADSFFEWKNPGTPKKVPYRVTLKNGEPFAMAGIWDTWKKPDGKELRSFAIVTTNAADSIKYIHDRMPVILPKEAQEIWLDAKSTPAKLLPLLKPLPGKQLDSYEISTLVNKPANDKPEIIKRVDHLIPEDEHFLRSDEKGS